MPDVVLWRLVYKSPLAPTKGVHNVLISTETEDPVRARVVCDHFLNSVVPHPSTPCPTHARFLRSPVLPHSPRCPSGADAQSPTARVSASCRHGPRVPAKPSSEPAGAEGGDALRLSTWVVNQVFFDLEDHDVSPTCRARALDVAVQLHCTSCSAPGPCATGAGGISHHVGRCVRSAIGLQPSASCGSRAHAAERQQQPTATTTTPATLGMRLPSRLRPSRRAHARTSHARTHSYTQSHTRSIAHPHRPLTRLLTHSSIRRLGDSPDSDGEGRTAAPH